MEELRLSANGLSFRCLVAGPASGPLVLLLHGFPEGAESWVHQLAALARSGLRAVAPDLRGYGGTDCPTEVQDYRMPNLENDVEGLVVALGRERCHLVGHDWGAAVGWSVASHRPQLVQSWSALSVGHPAALMRAGREDPDQRRRSEYIRLFRMPGKAEAVLAEDAHARLRRMYQLGPNPEAVPAEVVDVYVAGLRRPGRLTAALNYYRANLGSEAWEFYPPTSGPVRVPTQLIWGDQDPALGPRAVRETAAHVDADYRLEVLAGAGHWLQFERPEQVSQLLVEWVMGH